MALILLALAPVFIVMVYVYYRDTYEKEPVILILKGMLLGVIIIFPVGLIENYLSSFSKGLSAFSKGAFDGFVVAGATEELFKLLMVIILFWRNPNFNEKFDGIVYAVSVALGFAAIENIIYVLSIQSASIGWMRAFTAVPGHAIFGTVMGFYLGLARFSENGKMKLILLAFAIPWLMHGFYDFIILSGHQLLLLLFIPFLVFMYRDGLKRMRILNNASFFNPNAIRFDEFVENEKKDRKNQNENQL